LSRFKKVFKGKIRNGKSG